VTDDEIIASLRERIEETYRQLRAVTDECERERLCHDVATSMFHMHQIGRIKEMEGRSTILEFQRQLDGWGTDKGRDWEGRQVDPFMHDVLGSSDLRRSEWHALSVAFDTLDDLLAATREEILAVRGIGPRSLEILIAEFDRRGYRRPRRASRPA
jgi:hypothetical protein